MPAMPAWLREYQNMAQMQAHTDQTDGKSRRRLWLTVTILALAALAVYVGTFLQVLLAK